MSPACDAILPADGTAGCLVGRLWLDAKVAGPRTVVVRDDALYDLSHLAPTMSDLIDLRHAAAIARTFDGERLCSLDEALEGSLQQHGAPRLLAPCDLQAVKAAGVTFVESMLERVIEERALGDAAAAAEIRARLTEAVGADLTDVRPGSAAAVHVRQMLIERGWWSQYLEVGIGPDAEIFTKAQPMSAVGYGAQVGLHPKSAWNNPEPEIVLACDSSGEIVGATLGNDVNLRDFEGRSALLLGRAKDNNASCAVGPFIRLFDATFSLADLRTAELRLQIDGADGFHLDICSSMRGISRDPLDLVTQTIGAEHQYPDGMMLFLGTPFSPNQDRDVPGRGFTHKPGDRVTIHNDQLGTLLNAVTASDRAAPWRFGVRALMGSLADRSLIGRR